MTLHTPKLTTRTTAFPLPVLGFLSRVFVCARSRVSNSHKTHHTPPRCFRRTIELSFSPRVLFFNFLFLFHASSQGLAISFVCFFLSMVAFSSVYSMCKARRAREGMGYHEVQRPENSFEMMSLGGRDGVSMVLPQGY